ncbi:MAG: Ycf66 family protein [Cyanobacteria bacterium P01_A01_bin.135]
MAYILALVVLAGSVALYMSAFLFPEVHRRHDLVWSGVGAFYALVLWVGAGQLHGALLLGQMAAVALVGWFTWQTLSLRRQLVPLEQRTPQDAPGRSLSAEVGARLEQVMQWLSDRTDKLRAELSSSKDQ